jgi:hypothetical protein
MSMKNPVTPPGIDPGTVRLVAQRLDHYATPGPEVAFYPTKISDGLFWESTWFSQFEPKE